MERFNYPNIAAVLNEDARLLRMLELDASYGRARREKDDLARQQAEIDNMSYE